MENEGVIAMAGALKVNKTLESYQIDLTGCQNVQNDGVIAMADALKMNSKLRSYHFNFGHYLDERSYDEGMMAMVDALDKNFTLQVIGFLRRPGYLDEFFRRVLNRNRQLFRQHCALLQVARLREDGGFRNLAESTFRLKVLSFFLQA